MNGAPWLSEPIAMPGAPARPAPARWLAPALRGVAMALGLATVTSLYLGGAWVVLSWPQVGTALRGLGQVWLLQVGVCTTVLAVLALGWCRVPAQGPARAAGLVLLVLACGLAAQLVQSLLTALGADWMQVPGKLHLHVFWNLSLAGLLVVAHAYGVRSRSADDAWHDATLRRLALQGEMDAARLQLLQAQSEPHFLFNALANVRRLLRTDVPAARALLGDLRRYLEQALPALRDPVTTLGREADLVRAYLAVHQVRMGPRLQTAVDVAGPLGGVPVPTMVLLTLVENALKHGLQPQVAGGRIDVQAQADGDRLVLRVADTGRGMGAGSGGGTGLANLQARLKALYGPHASLHLAVNDPQGVVATVSLPLAGARP